MIDSILKKYKIKDVIRESKRYFKYNIIILIIGIIGNLFGYIYPYLQIGIVDKALTKKNYKILIFFSITFIIVTLLEQLFKAINSIITLKVESKIEIDLKTRLFQYFTAYENSEVRYMSSGKIDSLIKTDISNFQSLISSRPVQIIISIIQIIIYIFILMKLNLILAIFIMLSQILTIIVSYKQQSRLEKTGTELRYVFLECHSVLNEIIHWVTKLKLLHADEYIINKYKKLWKTRVINMQKMQLMSNKSDSIIIVLKCISQISIYLIGGYSIIYGNMTIGMLLGFIQYASSFSEPINCLIICAQEYRVNIAQISDIINCLNYIDKIEIKNSLDGEGKKLELKNVSFKYKDTEILDDINVVFHAGEVVCIYGRSGIGKSTLFNLLAGVESVNGGQILYNKQCIEEIIDWHKYISFYPQEAIIFNDTVYNNITLGSNFEKSKVREVCKDCCIYKEIKKMNNGFNSMILENGRNLSEGQKQRIALARVLIDDAPIIMLDEPTSFLDKKTERKFWKSIEKYSKDKIILVVTHSNRRINERAKIYELCDCKLKRVKG